MADRAQACEVLVVDDDAGLRLLLSDSLRAEGHKVAAAASGAAALAALRERRCDLMLLDFQLQDMAGGELLATLRREGLAVPFVVVTGQGDEKVAVEMMKQGALDYVMKDAAILDLLPSVVRRAMIALERERSLAAAMAEKARLEREILEVGENERQRIGADLHDGVGQRLTAIELMCVALKDDATVLDPALAGRLDRIAGLLRETIAQTRALARGLSPLDEQPEAFQNGLANLAAQADPLGRVRCRLECLSQRPLGDRAVAAHLYRIAQEAVHNAVKHSGASEVRLRWEEAEGASRLEIADNGRGLPAERSPGLGLGIMRYRAGLIGARLAVESAAGRGVSVVCTLPRAA